MTFSYKLSQVSPTHNIKNQGYCYDDINEEIINLGKIHKICKSEGAKLLDKRKNNQNFN